NGRQEAIKKAEQAKLDRLKYINNQIGILQLIASSYLLLGDIPQQIVYLNQGSSITHETGRTKQEAGFISSIGLAYIMLGETQKAKDHLNQAQKLQHDIQDFQGEAATLVEIASIDKKSGDFQKALNELNKVLEISQKQQNPLLETNTLYEIANVYENLGAYDLSIDIHKKRLEIFQQSNRSSRGTTVFTIGSVYLQRCYSQKTTEDCRQALNYFKWALIYYNHNRGFIETQILCSTAKAYELLKDYPQAIANAKQALELSRKNNLKDAENTALAVLSAAYEGAGDYQNALDTSKQFLLSSQQLGDVAAQASVYKIQGKIYASMKQPQQAIEAYNQELKLAQQIGDTSQQTFPLYNIAIIERDRGNFNQANTQIESAINIVENTRTKVNSNDLRTSYFATVQDYYKLYIDLLMQLHKKDPTKVCEFNIQDLKIKDRCDAVALHISERSRARGLVELLTKANVDIRKGVDPKLLAEERQLRWRIDAKEKRLSELFSKKESPAQLVATTKQQIESLLRQQQELKTKFRNTNSEYAALEYPQPLTLPQIQQQLDQDSLLLQYSLGEKRSYLWLVTPNSLNSYELPNSEKIEKAARNLNKQLTYPRNAGASPEEQAQAMADTTKAAQELSQVIIAPVAGKLGQKRLVVVADGILHQIPFAVLSDLTPQPPSLRGKGEQDKLKLPFQLKRGVGEEVNYQPLLVNHEIVNLPSVTSLATQRHELKGRKMAPKTIAVLADPVFSADDCRVSGKAPENSSSLSSTDDCKVTGKAPQTSSSLDIEVERSALQRSLKNINRSGLDRLLGTRQEAEVVLKMVSPSESFHAFDFDANYNLATSKQLNQYRLLLFATHGIFDNINPELSGIAMSLVDKQGKPQKGFLRLNDIFNLDLPAELIVLSACESGLGQEVKGEGLIGLTRGLMYAGSPRVIVSLWNVNDQATSLLMQELYKQILQQDKSPAVALREAQFKLWQQKDWQNPRYWAAFTVQGEWRNNY
ncbi:MAG: CHAT domain-containing protein, partial [Nostoc sp.]